MAASSHTTEEESAYLAAVDIPKIESAQYNHAPPAPAEERSQDSATAPESTALPELLNANQQNV